MIWHRGQKPITAAEHEDSAEAARVTKARYKWSFSRSCWVLCEGFSPVLHKVVL